MKLCRDCSTEKPLDEFYRDRSRPDGLNWRCKPCHRIHLADVSMRPPRHRTPEGTKRCQRCKETKPLAEFFADKNQYDGHARMCKPCQTTRHQQWVEENREQVNRYARQRYKNDPHRYMEYERRGHYGMAPGEYARMLAEQKGRCAICGTDDPAPRRNFAVDHCHETGLVRGLLCGKCNTGIGQLQHSIDIILSAARYLVRKD